MGLVLTQPLDLGVRVVDVMRKLTIGSKVIGWEVTRSLLPRLPTTPNDSQRLPKTANTRYRWLPMTSTDFHLLPPRELTPRPQRRVAPHQVLRAGRGPARPEAKVGL